MQVNLIAAGAPSRTPLGKLRALPKPLSQWGGGWLPLLKNSTPLSALSASDFGLSALVQQRPQDFG